MVYLRATLIKIMNYMRRTSTINWLWMAHCNAFGFKTLSERSTHNEKQNTRTLTIARMRLLSFAKRKKRKNTDKKRENRSNTRTEWAIFLCLVHRSTPSIVMNWRRVYNRPGPVCICCVFSILIMKPYRLLHTKTCAQFCCWSSFRSDSIFILLVYKSTALKVVQSVINRICNMH